MPDPSLPGNQGWLGIKIANVDQAVFDRLRPPDKTGVLVTELVDDGTAKKAGLLLPDDIVLAIDGKNIRDAREFVENILARRPRTTIELQVWRARQNQTIHVSVGSRE